MRLSNIEEDHFFFISFGINCQLQLNNYTFIFKHLAGMYFYSIFIYSTTFMYVNKNLRYSVILFPQWKHFVYSFIRSIIQRKKKALEKRHHIFLKCFFSWSCMQCAITFNHCCLVISGGRHCPMISL